MSDIVKAGGWRKKNQERNIYNGPLSTKAFCFSILYRIIHYLSLYVNYIPVAVSLLLFLLAMLSQYLVDKLVKAYILSYGFVTE